jgi:HAD superfamily hydrolase (TIGR01509 family)
VTSATGTLAVDAVIFDMDGVLVDSEPLHTHATKLLLADCGVDWDERESADYIGLTDVESFAALTLRHGLSGDPRDLATRWTERAVPLLRHARPMPGVPAVPLTLRERGYRLALASSSSRPRVIAATLDAIGARSLFEVVVSGTEVPRGKPSPDVFLEAARRLDIPPARCLVIEDSRHGVTAARAAGMRCIAIPCATTAHQDFAHATTRLTSLSDVLSYFGLAEQPA